MAPHPDYFLRLKHQFPLYPELNHEQAVSILFRVHSASSSTPYAFDNIDRPGVGELHAIFQLPAQHQLPTDGIRYLEPEKTWTSQMGNGREIEISEIKFGFVPGVENIAQRGRRRYRMARGGHPSVILLTYFKCPPMTVPPHLFNQPVRTYPLRPSNDPPFFVMGEKAGQKLPVQRQAMLSVQAQNNAMAQMEKAKRDKDRMNRGVSAQFTRRPDDEDEDHVTQRAVALSRFKRNHEFLAELFSVLTPSSDSQTLLSDYEKVNEEDLEKQLAKLTGEIEELRKMDAERSERPRLREADVIVDSEMIMS